MHRRYVVSLRKTGLGDRLVCLAAAWKYARDTQRTLVVDWRRSIYSAEQDNLFPLCFEPTDELAGVSLIADAAPDTAGLPRPIHPEIWEREDLIASPWHVHTDAFPEECARAISLIRSGEDVAASTVVFNGCIGDGIVTFDDARSCFEALCPVRRVADAVEAYREAHLGTAPWIGLHVRHGNGGDIMGHASSWQSFAAAIERCRRAVDAARERLGKQAPVLLCTDSADVQSEITRMVPGVVCRPKSYRPPGDGELHHGPGAAGRLDDALIDMLLLARCNALIRYPAASFFSLYAAVMKPTEDVHPVNLSSLGAPSDPQDRLSPAILF